MAFLFHIFLFLHIYIGTIWIGGRTQEFNENNFLLAIKMLSKIGVPVQRWTMNYAQDC